MIDLFNYKNVSLTLKIKVTPKAKNNKIQKVVLDNGEEIYKIYVTDPAEDGKANKAVIELIAKELGVKKSGVQIEAGFKSRDKIIKIIR